MKHTRIETRSAVPLETRNDPDPIEAAVQAVTEMRTAFDQRMAGLDELTARLDELETRAARPGTQQQRTEPTVEQRAFEGYVRSGREALSADEVRALRVGDDTSGGFLAPADFQTEMQRNLVEYSPVREAARVGTTARGSVIFPERTSITNAQWEGETEESEESDMAFGQQEIFVHEMRTYVDISVKLLEDSAVNIESELNMALGEDFGLKEGRAFVNGTGVKQPYGFMQNADIAYTANGHATILAADPLITLLYAQPKAYRSRGAWMMNGSTLATIRKLKDGQNNYLWQPSFQAGEPETILGRPVIEAIDMPDIGAGSFPIIYGDFAGGYRIYDRVGLSVLRDPFTMAKKGLVRFHARRRVGGAVTQATRFRKLKMATS
ncbi:phage major capsid protein [Mesorhizobium sp. WSM3876]|uniref:phage major capsid protein n=1 Tax=Mesorhizobium sp. WSM3876 TaxID=422277 RepID=UPI000BB013B6|nr:phage major capsid protein [Mesorhizobium sp. WSM3876]PBB85728.1 phage major capsid protein [Mesorhizobium sp. WSM3876]